MRDLTMAELGLVSGGTESCTPENSGNTYEGITDTTSVGDDFINLYEAAVAVTSHVIERVANAL